MNITMTFDPTDLTDLDNVTALIDHCRDRIDLPSADDVVGIVRKLMTGYGGGRTGYIRLVAAAGNDGASQAAVAAHFGGAGRAIGGTHSSIERAWRALGGTGLAEQFIETTPNGTHRMNSVFRKAVELISVELGLSDN